MQQLFPACGDAGSVRTEGLRECRSPSIVGSGLVAPRDCIDCFYRLAPGDVSGDLTPILPDKTLSGLTPAMPAETAARLLLTAKCDQPHGWWRWPNIQAAMRLLVDDFVAAFHQTPPECSGRGIVIPAGGKYFVSAYVTLRVLRHVGCRLPVEIWHYDGELTASQKRCLTTLNVQFINASHTAREVGFPVHASWWKGWQLKPLAIAYSQFREVLLLDADCYPVRDPAAIFDWEGYRAAGAVFWPDLKMSSALLRPEAIAAFGLSPFEDHPTESGQLLIDKSRCWKELNLALFLNRLAPYTYQQLWGDKDTFPIAWKRLGTRYTRMWPTAGAAQAAILQYDWDGRVLFQHRAADKFRLDGVQFHSTGQPGGRVQYDSALAHERFCFDVLRELEKDESLIAPVGG